jgi:hypothetical protein
MAFSTLNVHMSTLQKVTNLLLMSGRFRRNRDDDHAHRVGHVAVGGEGPVGAGPAAVDPAFRQTVERMAVGGLVLILRLLLLLLMMLLLLRVMMVLPAQA